MTLDLKKKIEMQQNGGFFKKNLSFAKKSDGFWPGKITFFIQS